MATLKAYQVAAAALAGGFPPNEVPRAVAVAKGESSFNTKASNSCCQGLWQINRKAHASAIAAAGGVDKLDDPVVNAKLAYGIWKAAGGWCTSGRVGQCNPWQAYGVSNLTGSWSSKLAEGARAYAEVQKRQQSGESLQSMTASTVGFPLPNFDANPFDNFGGDVPGLGDLADAAGAIAGFAQAVVDFGNRVGAWIADPQSWVRVAEVVGGGLLVALGLRIAFNKQVTDLGRTVVKYVKPGGKAAQLAKGKL